MEVNVAHGGQKGPVTHGQLVGSHFDRFPAILAVPDACLGQLLDVVQETVQVPLRVHLGLAAPQVGMGCGLRELRSPAPD